MGVEAYFILPNKIFSSSAKISIDSYHQFSPHFTRPYIWTRPQKSIVSHICPLLSLGLLGASRAWFSPNFDPIFVWFHRSSNFYLFSTRNFMELFLFHLYFLETYSASLGFFSQKTQFFRNSLIFLFQASAFPLYRLKKSYRLKLNKMGVTPRRQREDDDLRPIRITDDINYNE